MVLCIRQDRDPKQLAHAWVVDTGRGALIFDGPTELRISTTQNQPVVGQAGDYAVATVNGEGAHGVGPRAELTWFVPGNGIVGPVEDWDRDAAPQPLAVQGGVGSSTTNAVFSVSDGKLVKPVVPQGGRSGLAFVYPGGFGYEYDAACGYSWDRVAYFDASGRELSQPDLDGTVLTGWSDIPIVRTPSADVVLTLDGRKLVELPKSVPMRYSRLMGDRRFVTNAGDGRSWRVNTTLIQRVNDELFSLVAPS